MVVNDGNKWLDDGVVIETCPVQKARMDTMPKFLIERAYEEYTMRYGRAQTLEEINARGGFEVMEVAFLLYEAVVRLENYKERSKR